MKIRHLFVEISVVTQPFPSRFQFWGLDWIDKVRCCGKCLYAIAWRDGIGNKAVTQRTQNLMALIAVVGQERKFLQRGSELKNVFDLNQLISEYCTFTNQQS
ncbi:hypothetical protein ACFL3I_14070 [Pseudomonadota bacterium]